MLRPNKLIFAVTLSFGVGTGALAQETCPDPIPAKPSPEQLIACIVELQTDLAIIEARPQLVSSSVPSGAVLPFDAKSCPTDWTEFEEAGGKTIVGVDGKSYHLTYVGNAPKYQVGGTEEFVLREANLPSHSHASTVTTKTPLKAVYARSNDCTGHCSVVPSSDGRFPNAMAKVGEVRTSVGVTVSGTEKMKSLAVDNRMPFIALRFCKKD